jgi:phosphonate transport system substrate-binding protein
VTKKLQFGVGPLLPTPDDTKRAWDPFFKHLAERLDAPGYELQATTDWAGISVAMGAGQVDVAWMGPWGYVLARHATDCYLVATVKYDDKPIYHAIIIAAPDTKVAKFPDDSKGMSMSFADVGSTSGWLIPSFYAKEVWKIDPKTYWKYSEGATHAANEIAVAERQVDLATDFDRNRNAMIDAGRLKPDATKVVWTSDPLPNDAIALPKEAAGDLGARVQRIVTEITAEQAKTLLPARYTGFVAATHEAYKRIEDAGIAVGKIKPK